MAPLPVLERRLAYIKHQLEPKGIKVGGESPSWSQVQGVLARGDLRLAAVLATVDKISLSGWRRAFSRCHLDLEAYINQRWEFGDRLPWAVLELGTSLSHLEKELSLANIT